MVSAAASSSSSFDPAAHLHKQGWKGKGTALKQGHATRPLAVVQKRTLAGIGKDRDEAVPFWDQIFASTAASIFTPTPPGSGSSSPLTQHAAHNSTRSWITTSYDPSGSGSGSGSSTPLLTVRAKEAGVPSTQARVGKEMARKGLYSRFLRGKPIVFEEPEPEPEAQPQPVQPVASTSTSTAPLPTEPKETKAERRARRAAKAQRRAEKEAKKAAAAAAAAAAAVVLDASKSPALASVPDGKKRKKDKRKRQAEGGDISAVREQEKVDQTSTSAGSRISPSKKKKKA